MPDASVSDNVPDGLKTEVKVTFGMDEIALSGNTFVAEKVGVYTVTYTVTDKAGNQTQKVVLITATEKISKGGGGCGSIVSGGPLIVVAIFGAVVFLFMKKCKESLGNKK